MDYSITTRKIQILVNESDIGLKNEYYKLLRDYQYKTYRLANEIIKHAFFTDILKEGIGANDYRLTGKELASKLFEVFGDGSSKRNFGYKFASEEFKKLPSYIRTSLNSIVYSSYNEDKKDMLNGSKSIRSYKRNMPVPFMKTAITTLKNENKDFTFNLFSIPCKTFLGKDRSNNRAILENILSGTYLLCDSSYIFDENKMFLLLTFKSPKKEFKLDKERVCGVDLGINIPVCVALNNDDRVKLIGNRDDFFNQRIRIQKAKHDLQKKFSFYCWWQRQN